jgi:hypothetical protein
MSLVGSLEDLGLGDILQIVHLSRKSGTLWIRSAAGEGQVVFSSGLICGAFTKDGPADLRDLLAARGAVPVPDLDAAVEEARARGLPLERALVERGVAAAEALDELRRAHVEEAVIRMFGWATGEFSFEIQDRREDGGEDLFLSPGLNPQFLALEGTRLRDEAGRGDDDGPTDAEADAAFAEPGAEAAASDDDADALEASEHADALDAGDALSDDGPIFLASEAADDGGEDEELLAEADLVALEDESDAEEKPEALAAEPVASVSAGAATEGAAASAAAAAPIAIVVIDPDLPSLEWLKAALAPASPRVHIFQRSDQGVQRVRQYLARAEVPALVLSVDAPPDPVSGARDVAEMVRRFKLQAPRMQVFLARRLGDPDPRIVVDGVLDKPTATHLADPRCAPERERLADALRTVLRAQLASAGGSAPRERGMSPDTLARLRRASARLRDPASRGDVLTLVLRFAAETFSRVAMFMVRDDSALAIAQLGLPKAGGPDDQGIGDVVVPAREPAWFRRVLDGRNPVRCAPDDDGDQRLAILLGNALPREAYVAPLESANRIVALLYGDNLPTDQPIGDTAALEVVLHEAGLVLDRAVLERALAEAEQASGA